MPTRSLHDPIKKKRESKPKQPMKNPPSTLEELKAENARLAMLLEKEIQERRAIEEVLLKNEQISRELAETALRQARELTLLDKVRSKIAAQTDMPALLKSVVKSIVQVYGYTHVSIYLIEGDALVLQYQLGYKQVFKRIGLHEGISGMVARTGEPMLVEDVRSHPDFIGDPHSLQSEVTVPLRDNNQVVGTLSVESVNKLTEADLKILAALSTDVSVAIGRTRLYEDIQRRNLTLSTLQEATLAVMRQLSLPHALQTILTQAAQLIGTAHGYIYLIQPDGSMQVAIGMGIFPKYIGMDIQPGEGLAGRIWKDGQPLLVQDYQNWEGRSEKYKGTSLASVMGAPLMNGSHFEGVLGLSHLASEAAFNQEDLKLLSQFAQLASMAINNTSLYTQVQQELSEHLLAEEEIRSLEEKYRSLVEQMPLVVYQDQPDELGTNLYISPQVKDLLGYKPEEFQGNPNIWQKLIYPSDYKLALDTIPKTIAAGRNVEDYRMVTRNGDVIWVRDTAVLVRDISGNLKFIQGFLENITDRKQTVESLRKSEERLQAFFNQSLDGFFFCDFEEPIEWKHASGNEETLDYIINTKHFTEVNDAMLQQYGVEREKFLQLTTKDVFAHDPQQGRKLRRELFNKGYLHLETYERTVKDVPVWFEGDYVCLYDSNERITGYFGIQRDITDRKNTEQALRESEARYRTLFTDMLDGMYRSTHTGKFVDVNPALVKMFGYSSREEMLQLDIKKDLYFSPDERGSHILDTGQQEIEIYRMRRKDGSEIWVEDHGSYVHDEQGNVLFHEGILRDISERKLAEDALKRSESFTKSIVENEPECVKILTKGGVLEYMNPAGLAMIEADNLDSVAGKSVLPIIDEKDRKAFIDLTKRVLNGEQGTLQFEITGLKGTHRWLETHAVPLYDEHGNVTSLLGLTRDITERKHAEDAVRQAEEKYRSIFENAIEGIYQSSPEGRFITVNPAFATIMGYASPQEMVTSIKDIASQLYIETSRRNGFTLLLEEEGSITGFEYQMRRKDGDLVWVSENARLVRDSNGKILYYEGILEDITARKQNEQRLDNHLKQLNALHLIDNAINSNFDLRMTLEVLLREVLAQLKVDAASVLLFNKDTHTLNYTAGRGFLSKATRHTKLSVGEGFAGRVIVERKTIHIPNLTRTDNRLTAALSLAGENFTAYVGSPLIAKGQIVGVLEIFQRAPLNPDQDWFDFLGMITDQAAIAIENAQLFENIQRSNFELTLAYDATIEGWSRALDLRDRETEGHTQRVTNMTIKLAQRMGVPDTDILHIRRGALLHDIGKMGIPDNILHKPDKLSPEEWDIMHQHTIYAYNMLTPINYLKPALDIPRYHHERWDGTGYPEGLRGEQIPIAARIFAVVDVWDALASKRAYREAWPKEKVAEHIRTESGRHFDPRVVDIFLSLIEEEEHS